LDVERSLGHGPLMASVTLTALPDGPYRVEGSVEIIGSDERAVAAPTDPVDLCRCGRSQAKPFCDGSHARTSWTDAGDA
jgi:CDGSH-type Zn-finger protein